MQKVLADVFYFETFSGRGSQDAAGHPEGCLGDTRP